jgi:hypothetical protein
MDHSVEQLRKQIAQPLLHLPESCRFRQRCTGRSNETRSTAGTRQGDGAPRRRVSPSLSHGFREVSNSLLVSPAPSFTPTSIPIIYNMHTFESLKSVVGVDTVGFGCSDGFE